MTTPLREIIARFGFEFDEAAADRAEGLIGRVMGAATRLGSTLLAGVSAAGVTWFINSMIETGGELEEVSGRLNISATDLATWRVAANEAGAGAENVERSIQRMSIVAARTPALLHRLGVATRDSAGELRSANDVFTDAGVALSAIENDTERTARAQELFGRQGAAVLRVFEGGRSTIDAYRERVRALYGTDLDRLAEMSDQAGDAQAELDLALDAVSTRLAIQVIPWITRGIESVVGIVTQFQEWSRRSRFTEAVLLTLGATAALVAAATVEVWGPPLAVFLLAAALIAGVTLALDDLLVAADGGESVIGTLGDSILGVGATQGALQGLISAFGVLRDIAAAAWTVIRPIAEFLGRGAASQAALGIATAAAGTTAARDFVAGSPGARNATGGDVLAGSASLFGAAASLFGPVGTAVSGAISGVSSVTRSVSTGPIYVTGSGDPEATARAVRREIDDAAANDSDDDTDDLVPVGGS